MMRHSVKQKAALKRALTRERHFPTLPPAAPSTRERLFEGLAVFAVGVLVGWWIFGAAGA